MSARMFVPGSPKGSPKGSKGARASSFASLSGMPGPAIAPGSPKSPKMSPKSSPIMFGPEDHETWKRCVDVVRGQLGEITGNVAITMGGTHGQIDVSTNVDKQHSTRIETKIPPFVVIPRGYTMFQILAAPFTVPHYGLDDDFKKQIAVSRAEMMTFLTARTPTPVHVMDIADKMKTADDFIHDFLKKTLPANYTDHEDKVRSKLEKVATARGVPISYTSYQNANVNDARVCAYPQWNIGATAASAAAAGHCNVPLLDKTYLLRRSEYAVRLDMENEWKFTLYYLGKGGKLESFNILDALIRFAPIAKHPDMMKEKKHSLRQSSEFMLITTQNIINLVHDLGFTTHLHVDVTCNVIRDDLGRGLSITHERTMRRDLNLLYIPHQLAIQTGRVSVSGLDALLRKLLFVPIAEGGGRHRRGSNGHHRRRQTRRSVRHSRQRPHTRKIRTRRRH